MTTRERWLLTGLILVTLALPVLAIWQQVRYARAERAVQEFIALDAQPKQAATSRVALVRQAKPEIQHSLSRGDFNAALQRLAALREEDTATDDDKKARKSIAVNDLWPPGSPARKKAQQVLLLVARKQREGYDVDAAHEALVRVADAARSGKKKEALAAFKDVETLTASAPLRPGFKVRAVQAALPATTPGLPAAPGRMAISRPGQPGRPANVDLNAITPAQVQQFLQFFQLALPQLMERANPAQRDFLRRLQPFVNEAGAAYSQGKDIRPIIPLMQQLGRAVQTQNQAQAEALLAQAQVVLRTAKPLPKGYAAGTGAAIPPQLLKRLRGGHGPAAPAVPPPGSVAPAMPRPGLLGAKGTVPKLTPDNILQALDTIRQLPEPVYRQQRPQIALLIGRAFAGMGGARPDAGHLETTPAHRASRQPDSSALRPDNAALHAGNAAAARLDLTPAGAIVALSGLGRDLSDGASGGGVFLSNGEHGETALRGSVKAQGNSLSGVLSSGPKSAMQCDVTVEADGRDLTIRGKAQRGQPGASSTLEVRIPVHVAGWYWDASDTPQVIAVDGQYQATADAGGRLPLVTLRGAGIRLAVSAPTAAAVAYDSAAGALMVKFPIASTGATEFSLQLTVSH